jgi:para-nitrobenzyl esterase
MSFPPECAIRWFPGEPAGGRAGEFVARVKPEDCAFPSASFRQTIRPDMTYVVAAGHFGIQDILNGEDGKPLFPSSGISYAARVSPLPAAAASEVIRIDTGRLQGVAAGDVVSFKGIPYAAPPVGALRWRAPQPARPWSGTRVAATFGHACLQPAPRPPSPALGAPLSEDCLYLNVWRPAKRSTRLPVMVWIHGGSLVTGAASVAGYDGTAFARRGVVLVSINYRLGYPGFFAHPALTREAADGSRLANYGLMDQVAALQWVKRNIAAFGGDPSRVTIFGQSAGAFSVQALLASPPARGLFHRAIVQSGYYRGPFPRIAERAPDGRRPAEEDGIETLRAIGIEASDVAALRALTPQQLLSLPPHGVNGAIPAIDGRYVIEDFWASLRNGRVAAVPLIVGATSQETPPLPPDVREKFRATLAKFISAEEEARLLPAYGGQEALDTSLSSDFGFAAMMRSLANFHLAHGHPAYRYRFAALPDAAPAALTGLPHSGDIPYVFGTLDAAPWKMAARDRAVSDAAMDYWVEFARTGRPSPKGRPAWPVAEADQIMLFDNEGPKPQVDDRAARYRALAEIVDPRS